MVKEINEWYVLVTGFITGTGSLVTWFLTKRYAQENSISKNRKETKVNNVDGDAALIEQLDTLLAKVSALSEVIVKIQSESAAIKDRELSYRSAFHRLKLLCDEVCTDAAFCKGKIDSILNDLKLN